MIIPMKITAPYRRNTKFEGTIRRAPANLMKLGAGVELEGGPVVGLAEVALCVFRVEERELGGAEGRGRVLATAEFGVEGIHEVRCCGVADFPQGTDDVVRARAEERP